MLSTSKNEFPNHLDLPFKLLLKHPSLIVFIKDRNGRFTFMNTAGTRLLGLSLDEIIGEDEMALFGTTAGFEGWETDRQVMTSGQPLRLETHWLTQSSDFILETTKYPYTTQDGSIVGIIGISYRQEEVEEDENEKDGRFTPETTQTNTISPTQTQIAPPAPPQTVPQETHILEQNRSLIALQAAMNAVTSSLDLNHVIETFVWEMVYLLNADNCIIFSWDNDEQTLSKIGAYHLQNPQQHDEAYSLHNFPLFKQVITDRFAQQTNINQVEPSLPELNHLKTAGIQSLLVLPMMVREQVTGLVGITKHHQPYTFSDQEITVAQMLTNQAASSIVNAQLYQKLEETNQALQVSNEELDAFSRTVAHDLKGPLGIIIGFASLITSQNDMLSEDETLEYLMMINNNGQKMRTIIDALLLLARIRREDVQCQPIQMTACILEAKARLSLMIEEHQAEILVPFDLPIACGYGPWIEEVWANYLSNGIKYGGRPARLECGADELSNGMIKYWVKDNGPGLTSEQQSKLFTPFTRLNSVNIEGHGLGLSIVQRIIEKLNGSVGVESQLGEGSSFFFTLPFQQEMKDKILSS